MQFKKIKPVLQNSVKSSNPKILQKHITMINDNLKHNNTKNLNNSQLKLSSVIKNFNESRPKSRNTNNNNNNNDLSNLSILSNSINRTTKVLNNNEISRNDSKNRQITNKINLSFGNNTNLLNTFDNINTVTNVTNNGNNINIMNHINIYNSQIPSSMLSSMGNKKSRNQNNDIYLKKTNSNDTKGYNNINSINEVKQSFDSRKIKDTMFLNPANKNFIRNTTEDITFKKSILFNNNFVNKKANVNNNSNNNNNNVNKKLNNFLKQKNESAEKKFNIAKQNEMYVTANNLYTKNKLNYLKLNITKKMNESSKN